MNYNDYFRLSLELHLFFDRIMMEHSFFLESGFTENNNSLKITANNFKETFGKILMEVIGLTNGNVSSSLLYSNEIVTANTLEAEKVSSSLSGIPINFSITKLELGFNNGKVEVNEKMLSDISKINKKTLPLLENLIDFKEEILKNVLSCKIYTTNYPSLIEHILSEAKMYYNLLSKVEKKIPFSNDYMYKQEMFWNHIMMEHAYVIRGLLDPSEKELMKTANIYANEYFMITKNFGSNLNKLTALNNDTTKSFKNFKEATLDEILNCKVKSIIVPLLLDHLVREANHFIRILSS